MEVQVPEVSLGPAGVGCQGAREAALVEGYPGDDGDVPRLAGGKQLVFRVLVEGVVDHLNGIDEAGVERAEDVLRLEAVHANPDGAHEFLLLQRGNCPLPAVVVCPCVAPDVQLLEVEGVHADVLEALLRVLADVVGWIDVVQRVLRLGRPLPVLRRDLRGHVQPLARVPAQGLAKQPFAVPVAVRPGGVEEVAPELDGAVERA